MKKTILAIAFIGMITSCNKPSEQIEQETASGVVLIQNRSFYEVVLSNGESIYFSTFDEDGDVKGIATDEDSVEVVTTYGTGFFISERGEIATNAHVVSNMVSEKEVSRSVSSLFRSIKKLFKAVCEKYEEKYEEAQSAFEYAYVSDEVSVEDFNKVRDYRDAVKEELDEFKELLEEFNEIQANECEFKYRNEVRIAYNDTYVTNTSDFIPCVIVKTDSDHDLAIIQLKDKETPPGKYVFTIEENDPLEKYSWEEKLTRMFDEDKNNTLYMSSFNLGPTLALTDEGIKSQFNQGSISQKTNDRIMYSIPTLPGSSGSPVVNMRGQLVAVNYAGLSKTQNFNYGIRIKYLKKLVNE